MWVVMKTKEAHMPHVETNEQIPTAAQAKRDTREQYKREILDELAAAENKVFAVAHRLRHQPYNDDTNADRAHRNAARVYGLRIDLGGEE